MITKKAQNILYISLSHEWSSRERGILKDGIIIKENGRTPFLYCYKNSPIERKAFIKGIKTIHPGKAFSGLFKWRMFLTLPQIVKKFNIDLIHFYQIEFVWSLCFFLYRFIEIPLVLTQCSGIKKFYTNIFYRTLAYRIDLFLCPFVGLKQNISSHLMVRSKKITYCGLAPLFTSILDYSEKIPEKEKSGLLMGVFFHGDKNEEYHIRVLFRALAVFNEEMNQSVFLELISETSWKKNPSYQLYRELSWEYQIGNWISFKKNNSLHKAPSHFDLWLELPHREDLEHCTFWAILSNTPVLVPRTASSMELFESYGRAGEYYKSDDGREFWQKGLQMLQNIDFYKKELVKTSEKMRKSCDESEYSKRILKLYDGLKTRRWAYKWKMSRS